MPPSNETPHPLSEEEAANPACRLLSDLAELQRLHYDLVRRSMSAGGPPLPDADLARLWQLDIRAETLATQLGIARPHAGAAGPNCHERGWTRILYYNTSHGTRIFDGANYDARLRRLAALAAAVVAQSAAHQPIISQNRPTEEHGDGTRQQVVEVQMPVMLRPTPDADNEGLLLSGDKTVEPRPIPGSVVAAKVPPLNFSEWGLGTDGAKWHLFRQRHTTWLHHKRLEEIGAGRQSQLLRLLLEGKGRLTIADALESVSRRQGMEKQKLKEGVKQDFSRIRSIVLAAMGYDLKGPIATRPDPFEWDGPAYNAKVYLGHAQMTDDNNANAKERLRFVPHTNPTQDQ